MRYLQYDNLLGMYNKVNDTVVDSNVALKHEDPKMYDQDGIDIFMNKCLVS
jgi:hypothetical protein